MSKRIVTVLAFALMLALFGGMFGYAMEDADPAALTPTQDLSGAASVAEAASEEFPEAVCPEDAVDDTAQADCFEEVFPAGIEEPALPIDGAASGSGYDPHSIFLAFGSDRHGVTTAISSAMSGMPDAVSYVCLIGDMVNGTNSYKSSSVLKEVQDVFGPDTQVDITYGDHDKNCTDDARIFHRNSGLIETGYRDGRVQYYVYGISMDDMTSAAAAKNAAERFKRWVDESCSDTRIPIIVASHVPLHYAREDNPGGEAWNEALNYAATGFAASDSGKEIIRNVVFLHGHNHTKPSDGRKNYNISPGTGGFEIQGASGKKSCTLYYSYLTAGYMGLESSGGGAGIKSIRSTLMELTESSIILYEYPASSPASAVVLQTVKRVSEASEGREPVLGDVNHDGRADAMDAALILQFAADLPVDHETLDLQAADVDRDGSATGLDAAHILRG